MKPVDYTRLTMDERRRVRLQYIEHQNGKCQHCAMPLDEAPANEVYTAYIDKSLFPPRFFEHPVHLHHSHDTGMTIGAVHARCNAWLWQYRGE